MLPYPLESMADAGDVWAFAVAIDVETHDFSPLRQLVLGVRLELDAVAARCCDIGEPLADAAQGE